MSSENIHRVKSAEVEFSEDSRCVTLTIVYDELVTVSEHDRFNTNSHFFGDVELEKQLNFFLHESTDESKFIASLGLLPVPSL
jgi:hypothetical protein